MCLLKWIILYLISTFCIDYISDKTMRIYQCTRTNIHGEVV